MERSSLRQVEDPLIRTEPPCQQCSSSRNGSAGCTVTDPRADGGYCSPGGHDWGSKPDTVADESAWKVIRLRQRGRAENRSGSQEPTGGLNSRKRGGTFSRQVVEQMGELEISSRWAGQQVRHRRASVKQG